MMGYGTTDDDLYECFNGVKNFQLGSCPAQRCPNADAAHHAHTSPGCTGWFDDAIVNLSQGDNFTGSLKGHVNYVVDDANQDPVVIKIDVANNSSSLYISFNHAVSYNAETGEGADQIMIHSSELSGKNDVTFNQYSYIEAILGGGVGNLWQNGLTGADRIGVKVNSITTDQTVGSADVLIRYGPCTSDDECDDGLGCTGSETCNLSTGQCQAPSQCASLEYRGTSGLTYSTGVGVYFKLEALVDVAVTQLRVRSYSSGSCTFRIYHKAGDFVGSETNSSAWIKILDSTLDDCQSFPDETILPEFASSVSVQAGSNHSFYVWTPNTHVYEPRTDGGVYANNTDMKLFSGNANFDEFGTPSTAFRLWNGRVTYGISDGTFSLSVRHLRQCAHVVLQVDPQPPSFLVQTSPTTTPTRSPSLTDLPTTSPTRNVSR